MTVENGCPVMIPRSHLGPVLDHHQNGVFIGAVTDPRFRPAPVVHTEVRAGGVTIHHVRTVHGSEPNRSDRQRRLLLFQYCALDAFPLLGVTDWDAFYARVLRGEPTCEFRAGAGPRQSSPLYARPGAA